MNKSTNPAILACTILLMSNVALMAQSMGKAERRSISNELDVWVSKTAEQLVPAADAMPEEKYGFAPTAGRFDGVRTFAEQVKHLAATNYVGAAAILGEKPLHQERAGTAPDSIKSKAKIMEYLKGSFVYLHRAAAAIICGFARGMRMRRSLAELESKRKAEELSPATLLFRSEPEFF